jgi:MoxR-like ATPase/ribosomal protein L7/L12
VLGPALIKYGGAPAAVVEQVADAVERTTGTRPSPDKEWVSSDDDVWIYVPVAAAAAAATRADSGASDGAVRPPDLTAWLGAGPAAAPPVGSLLSVESERLRVGEIVLPRCTGARSPLAPDPAAFAHYCLDGITAETLVHVTTSVLLREPCLLEGETSTSKTSSILFLASVLGQPVVRLNLNGQTDTGELVGRFLPQSLASGLPIPEEELFEDRDLLESETRMILGRAREERRMLTKLEVQQVMANEQMRAHPWRWQDGLVVQAMRKGWWVLLDEVNLAEPQILERLNSVLEPIPSLVLTEHDNSVLGPGGTPVHPGFRIFATMNPAEYEGRSTLSPAYRDRWRAYRFVPPPGEAEYYQMLRRLVFGEQPAVMVLGRPYLGTAQDAPYSALAGLPGIVPFLEALARFHVGLESGVRQRDGSSLRLGVRRREPYVFSRRGLLSLIEFLARRPFGVQDSAERVERTALARYYLARVADPEDQEVVVQLLDAVGLGPKQSAVVPAPPGAAAPPAPPGPGGARVELPKAPPASTPAATLARASAGFKLVLLRLSRDAKKIDLVKALRRRTALSLRDAKELVDTPGSVLMTAGTEEEARRLRRDLRKFGAHLRILASGES